jgi:hypothetical protein
LMSVKLKILVSADFVWLALNELKRDGLIENADELEEYFAKINRREIIKKVGFASMIALPIVSSVVAPHAAQAQTCQPFAMCNAADLLTQGTCCPGERCLLFCNGCATPPPTILLTPCPGGTCFYECSTIRE